MARTNNKYTSINFNHIHDKNVAPTTNPNNLHSPNAFLPHKNHGRMLVLTRPVSKPAPAPAQPTPVTPPLSPSPKVNGPARAPEPHHQDQISLRPLGRTGAVPLGPVPERERERERQAPRTDKFVPPHLRPGFAGREERPGPAQRQQQQQLSRPVLVGPYGEDGRPKSGGGYERVRGELDPGLLDRPRSSGNRSGSTGWYAFNMLAQNC